MANNNYLIYGDDHRVDQEDLEQLMRKAEKLLEIRNKRFLKKRAKTRKQPSVKESKRPQEELQDILQETPEQADKETTSEEKKKSRSIVPIIILLMLLIGIALLTTCLFLKQDMQNSENTSNEVQINDVDSPQPVTVVKEEHVITTPVLKGYLASPDPDKEYELGETLSIAKVINEETSNYLDFAIQEIKKYQDDPEYDYVQGVSEKRARIGSDMETLKDYEPVYAAFGGYSYIRAAEDRMTNVASLYDELNDEKNDDDLIRAVNRYIENENVLTENAKAALIEYLNENEVDYELTTATIKYDSMQFEKEDEGQIQEGTETGETDKEESIYK